jgi:hypothetical protein
MTPYNLPPSGFNLPPGVGVHDIPGNEHPSRTPFEPQEGEHRGERYSLAPARYARGKIVLRCEAMKPNGYKTEGHWLAEALGGRWTHRDDGHQLAPNRAQAWLRLFLGGYEASRKYFGRDRRPYTFNLPGGEPLTLAQALAKCPPYRTTPDLASAIPDA